MGGLPGLPSMAGDSGIAALVDMTHDQVRWRLHRMQRKLKKLIAAGTRADGPEAPPRR